MSPHTGVRVARACSALIVALGESLRLYVHTDNESETVEKLQDLLERCGEESLAAVVGRSDQPEEWLDELLDLELTLAEQAEELLGGMIKHSNEDTLSVTLVHSWLSAVLAKGLIESYLSGGEQRTIIDDELGEMFDESGS